MLCNKKESSDAKGHSSTTKAQVSQRPCKLHCGGPVMSTLIFSACNWLLLDSLSPQILMQSEYGNKLQVDDRNASLALYSLRLDKKTTEELTKEIT